MVVVVANEIKNWLQANIRSNCLITDTLSVSGGSINSAYFIKTTCGDYFIKLNHANLYPEMFELEMKGLAFLDSTGTIKVPSVLTTGIAGEFSYILMEYIKQGQKNLLYWHKLASDLALLHKVKSETYGLEYDNYIGSLKQSNTPTNDYFEFMINQRFNPLVIKAYDRHLIKNNELRWFETFFVNLHNLIPVEAPSLLHGDLWSGNIIADSNNNPYLIDPAIYFGNRETDLAMCKLFGGFSDTFFDAYNSYYPLESHWNDRVDIHQLYPLLVHLILFGSGYKEQVMRIIKHYS